MRCRITPILRANSAPTAFDFAIRLGSSTADLKVTATTGPTPGTASAVGRPRLHEQSQPQPCAVSRTAPSKLPAPKASPQQCAPTWYDLSPIPESALQTFCGLPGRPSGRNRAGYPECSIPHPATFREAACARPAALGSPAIQSIWRAPAGTIPSAADGQAHTHPCGPSSPSSPTMPPSRAASPAERLQIPLASARHAAIVITAPPQTQSDSLESQVP